MNVLTAVARMPRNNKTADLPAPLPLVKITKHPIRYMRIKIELLVMGALVAFLVGVPTIAALYYLVLETHIGIGHLGIYMHHKHVMDQTQLWHELVPNGTERHTYRAVFEGFYGGLLGKMIIWNHYKKPKEYKTLTASRVLLALVLTFILAVPGFFLGELIVHLFSHIINWFSTPEGVNESTWGTIKGVLTENLPKKIIGITAAFFFGRYAVHPIYDRVQKWYATRRFRIRRRTGKISSWWDTPTFKARCRGLIEGQEEVTRIQTSTFGTYLRIIGVTILVGLAVYGWIVLQVIAKHHSIHL